jgi:hypothetical protein
MSELKPCPFCGNEVEMVGVGAWNKCSAAWCTNCEIYGPQMATEMTAAYAWNRRPSPTAQGPEEGACGTCGEHANEHGAINHEYTKGGGPSFEGSTEADVRADQATGETGNDRPAAPISAKAGPVSEERIRNLRAWAAARVGSLSGADVTVAVCDELLRLRSTPARDVQEKP